MVGLQQRGPLVVSSLEEATHAGIPGAVVGFCLFSFSWSLVYSGHRFDHLVLMCLLQLFFPRSFLKMGVGVLVQ